MSLNHQITTRQLKPLPEAIFEVKVGNGNATIHTVSVNEKYYQSLTDRKISAEELIRRSFEFLLAREPKESILRQFDLFDINYYFPEYENEIVQYISKVKPL